MNDIERMFGGGRRVPGMRSALPDEKTAIDAEIVTERLDRTPAPAALEPEDDGDVIAVAPPPAPYAQPQLPPLSPVPELLHALKSDQARSERMRMLRTEILLRHRTQRGSVAIAVVGAGAGEGRSQLAAELAVAFSQLNRSTLLLDADMRRSRQHVLFGTEPGDGLAQAIERGDRAVLHPIEGFPTLSLMTAGTVPANPIELLSDGRFDALMDDLAARFEYIVIDTPPGALYADALVISTVVGHVLTVHRSRHTPYKEARSMLRQLESSRAEIVGAVLNNF